ncbi:Hypothetical protein LBF_2442 [Leptospira biflexa serovar Patoc strain 'Patoc 1 (Ames)']|nr:Hypothetical protein LBF_2442 [Leptospira biflexa serovar Patoc strain 'Patoc 1 (Ames)']
MIPFWKIHLIQVRSAILGIQGIGIRYHSLAKMETISLLIPKFREKQNTSSFFSEVVWIILLTVASFLFLIFATNPEGIHGNAGFYMLFICLTEINMAFVIIFDTNWAKL